MAAEEEESCSWYDAFCHAGEAVGDMADSAIADFIESIYSAAVVVLDLVGTWWMEVGGPDFDSSAVSGLQENLRYFVWFFGVIGFMVALGKMAISQDARQGTISIGGQLFRMILASGVYMTAIPLLLDAGDSTSRWLLVEAHGDEAEAGFSGLLGSAGALMSLSGAAFLIYILLFLGSIVNFIFMLFRNVMFLVIIVFIPAIAASSSSEAGQTAWRKVNGWLLALLLFKPVAAAIYALGFRLMRDNSSGEGFDEIMQGLVSSLTGLLILVLAALALPALIKFVVPAAAAGAGAFSGGAALGATAGVAAGAAVVAATGGTAAAGGAAASSGAASAGTSGAGAASAGSSGAATANGASSTSSAGSGASGATADNGSATGGDSTGSSLSASSTTSGSATGGEDTASSATPSGATVSSSDGGTGGDTSADGAPSTTSDVGATTSAPTGSNKPNWGSAIQAHQAASGAMSPQQSNEEDEA